MIIEGERFHDVKLFLSDSGVLRISVFMLVASMVGALFLSSVD